MKIVVIDNYDSFTYNLVQLVHQSCARGAKIEVFRNDKVDLKTIINQNPAKIIISPGPKNPSQSGLSKVIVESFYQKVPILGVCLGHQIIGEIFGGKPIRAPKPIHGHTSKIFHNGTGLFSGINSPFTAARYHSLILETSNMSKELSICAYTEDRLPMALQHSNYPLFGVQFHPESFLTEYGIQMMNNFVNISS